MMDLSTVVVARGIHTRVGFGRGCFYQFELRWVVDGISALEGFCEPYELGPTDSKQKRYVQGRGIGGRVNICHVWAAVDVTLGTTIAVKKFHGLSKEGALNLMDFYSRFKGTGSIQQVSTRYCFGHIPLEAHIKLFLT